MRLELRGLSPPDGEFTGGRNQSSEGMHQGRLAGAVRPDHGNPIAGCHIEIDAVDDVLAAEIDSEVAAPHCAVGHAETRLRRRTRRKNGAPIIAVTTPMGSSAGAMTVRAATSVRTRNAAPSMSDRGRSSR